MPVTIQQVNASDTIDNGRIKFNANDTAIANGIDAVDSQLTDHVTEGHPDLYYSKSEIDDLLAAEKESIEYQFGYTPNDNKATFCGFEGGLALVPVDGSITRIMVTDTYGHAWQTEFAPGTYSVSAGDRMSLVAGPDIFPGDEINPLTGGIQISIYSATPYSIVVYASGVYGFPGYGNFAIMVQVTPT